MLLTFLTLMDRGGPLMWVIFITACIAMIMVVERAIALVFQIRAARQDHAELAIGESGLRSYLKEKKSSPFAQLLNNLDWHQIGTKEDLVKEINVHLTGMMPRLEGFLPTVATLGSILPMLGLLGTVTGMINVFEVIALHGSGKPDAMAQGISQALLTTASGLAIAIPIIFFHHLLVRRLDLLMSITKQSLHLVLNKDVEKLLAFKK